ncbi:hypothetical protein KAR91_24490 [Candidatus Pacearchaeota archaeon]|nr:hypothetical protein [Candidatus Pacearchaeota archaeon]
MSRLTKVSKKCLDIYKAYCREEITKAEMYEKISDIESKQLKLPMGRRRKSCLSSKNTSSK